jgi:hypothetical protein
MRVAIIGLLLASSSAAAADLSIDDKQALAIENICDIAATNPNIAREVRAQLAAWCVQWQQRIQDAQKAAPSSTATDPPPVGEQKK